MFIVLQALSAYNQRTVAAAMVMESSGMFNTAIESNKAGDSKAVDWLLAVLA